MFVIIAKLSSVTRIYIFHEKLNVLCKDYYYILLRLVYYILIMILNYFDISNVIVIINICIVIVSLCLFCQISKAFRCLLC